MELTKRMALITHSRNKKLLLKLLRAFVKS